MYQIQNSHAMNVLGCFDHAYVLNLPEDVERLDETTKELARCNIQFERLEVELINVSSDRHYNAKLGCIKSHLFAVQKARDSGYKNILIIEDDIVLRPNFQELWEDIAPVLPGFDYDLFYPYVWDSHMPLIPPIRIGRIKGTLCAHFYAISSKFYDRYISAAELQIAAGVHLTPLDEIFHLPDIKTLATSYNLAGQRADVSKITFKVRERANFSKTD